MTQTKLEQAQDKLKEFNELLEKDSDDPQLIAVKQLLDAKEMIIKNELKAAILKLALRYNLNLEK